MLTYKARCISPLFFFIPLSESIRRCIASILIVRVLQTVRQSVWRQARVKRCKSIHHKWKAIKKVVLSYFWKFGFDTSTVSHFSVMQLITILREVLSLYVFIDKKTQGKGRNRRKQITTFDSLKLVWFASIKNLFWRLSFRNSIQEWVFLPFTGPKKVLRMIPGSSTRYSDLK